MGNPDPLRLLCRAFLEAEAQNTRNEIEVKRLEQALAGVMKGMENMVQKSGEKHMTLVKAGKEEKKAIAVKSLRGSIFRLMRGEKACVFQKMRLIYF